MKKKYGYFLILIPLLAMQLSKFLVSVYGEESRIIIIFIGLLIMIISIIVLALKNRLYDAIMSICILIPLLISGVGMYLDNLILVPAGLGALYVVIIVFLIIKKKYNK